MTERPPIRRAPPDFVVVEVVAVADRSPWMRSITLAGPGLRGFQLDGPAASLRLLLRRDSQLELPSWTGNEFRFADGTRPPIRTVTPLRPDPERGSLDVEVVLHPDVAGPLSDWARAAEPGEQVAVSGPGRGYPIDPTDRRYLIVGDESALPAIGQLLEALPAEAELDVVVEVSHPDAVVELPDHPGAEIDWQVLPAGARPGDAMVAAVEQRSIDPSGRVWAAGEAAAVQRIRKHLEAAGVSRPRTTVRGYWKLGRAVGG